MGNVIGCYGMTTPSFPILRVSENSGPRNLWYGVLDGREQWAHGFVVSVGERGKKGNDELHGKPRRQCLGQLCYFYDN